MNAGPTLFSRSRLNEVLPSDGHLDPADFQAVAIGERSVSMRWLLM